MRLGLRVHTGLAVEGGSDGFCGVRPPKPLKRAGGILKTIVLFNDVKHVIQIKK